MISTVFALEFESAGFRARASRRLCSTIWTLGVTGTRSADVLDRLICVTRPSVLISAGFSGALTANLELGSIVLARNFSTPRLLEALGPLKNLRVGNTVTVNAILETAQSKEHLGEETGALAADMESSHIHKICLLHGVPMLSLRTISDTLHDDIPLPGAILINSKTGRSESAAIFRYLFRHPSALPRFVKLVSNAKTAQQSLASNLEQALPLVFRSLC